MSVHHLGRGSPATKRRMNAAQLRAVRRSPLGTRMPPVKPRPFDPEHMRILSLSRTPVAGVAVLLPTYINKYTDHKAKSLVGGLGYRDGRQWGPPDGLIRDARVAHQLVDWADVIVVHNGSWPRAANPHGKRIISYYHSEPRNVHRQFEQSGQPAYVIAQGHAALYPNMRVLPNIIDIEDGLMQPLYHKERPLPCDRVVVGYAPSNKHGRDYMSKNRFSAKGWPETMPVLEKLKREKVIDLRLFVGVPFGKCMEQRKACHIFVDEVITGSYHRSTLEACSHAQVAVNAMDETTRGILSRIIGGTTVPWIRSSPEALEETLRGLVKDPCRLEELCLESRAWMEDHWHPKTLLERWWIPALQGAKVFA